jgi:hypothetical protein
MTRHKTATCLQLPNQPFMTDLENPGLGGGDPFLGRAYVTHLLELMDSLGYDFIMSTTVDDTKESQRVLLYITIQSRGRIYAMPQGSCFCFVVVAVIILNTKNVFLAFN